MIVTRFLGYFENGAVIASYDYDDAASSPRMLRAFVENNGTGILRLTIKRKSDNQIMWTLDCEPGFSRERTFNNSQAQNIPVDITNPSKPQLTTYDVDLQYPWSG